jgi:hypothetical protein
MLQLFRAFAVFAITAVLVGGIAFAQTPPFWFFSPAPSVNREVEKSRIKQEEGRKKWSSCKKQARAQKIKSRGWNRFMKDCVAK